MPLAMPALRTFSTEFDDVGDVGQLDRRAVAIGHDEVLVVRRDAPLVVVVELEVEPPLLDGPLGAVRVGGVERGADVLEPDAVLEERAGIELDPYGRQRAAADIDLAHALDLREFLLEHGGGGVVDLAAGERVGGKRQDQDRRVGDVHLAVGRIAAQVRRQIDARRVDRRLHVARGAVDVAVEAELQRDARRAVAARGRHLGDIGDGAEMAFERRCDARRHDVGRGPRHLRLDRNGRHIDLRQRRHGKMDEGDAAGEHHAQRQKHRRDRAPDECLGQHHDGAPSPSPPTTPPSTPNRAASRSNAR